MQTSYREILLVNLCVSVCRGNKDDRRQAGLLNVEM